LNSGAGFRLKKHGAPGFERQAKAQEVLNAEFAQLKGKALHYCAKGNAGPRKKRAGDGRPPPKIDKLRVRQTGGLRQVKSATKGGTGRRAANEEDRKLRAR